MLAATGIAFAVGAFRSGTTPIADELPSAQTSPGPSVTGEPRITAEIPLLDPGDDSVVGGITVGAGSAWVSLPRGGAASLVRIDFATNDIAAEIPLQAATWRKRIAATDDAVWVASSGLLERIDPATNTVVARVVLPDRSISAIAADAAAVWVVTIGDDGGQPTGVLVRIDTATNEIAAEIPLGPQVAGYADEVMLGAGAVWVLGVRWFESEDAEYGSDLIRIDPVTNEIAARIPIGGFNMVMGTRDVWVRFPADGVFDKSDERWLWTRVDVLTNEPSEPFEFDDAGLRLVTPNALWSVGYDEQENVRVTRFDPETLQVVARSEPIRSHFTDAALDTPSGTVWVSAVYSVVRVDIADEAAPSASTAAPALS
jgi:hypothetical protein